MTDKSYAYDDVNYRAIDAVDFNIAAGSGASTSKFTSFTAKQLKSITLLPTPAGTSADVVKIVQTTNLAVVFVGAGGGTASGTAGTATSTITYNTLASVGSGITVATKYPLGGVVIPTVTVVQGAGTTTATNVTLPTGPNGGITMNQYDSLVITKGTDATVAYAGQFEYTYTPGTTFTV